VRVAELRKAKRAGFLSEYRPLRKKVATLKRVASV